MTSLSKRIFYLTLVLVILSAGCGGQHQATSMQSAEMPATKQGIVAKLKENDHLSVERQVALYKQLKLDHPEDFDFENEDELTMYGYGMLWEGRSEEALKIFLLIAEEFPMSANAFDSLGEAYYVLGQNDLALQNYEKSLAMNPDNYNAEEYNDKLLHTTKKAKTPTERFAERYSSEEYQEDLDDLATKLIKTNPSIYKFTSEADFLQLVEAQKHFIEDSMIYGQFRWLCNKIVAAVNCSHTSMGDFFPEYEMLPSELQFPLRTVWIDEHLYVTDALNNQESVTAKEEVVEVNGVPVKVLIDDIYDHIPSQGFITQQLYCVDQSIPSDCEDALCLELTSDNIAVLTIQSFNFYTWNNYEVFTDYMDKAFQKLKNEHVAHLIIDLRGNGGGSPDASIYLLRYLVEKPFIYFAGLTNTEWGTVKQPFENRFSGSTYYLIDGEGKSTTGHFMAMVREMKLGTILGEELGSNQFCSAGQTIYKLKNTRLQFYSANNTNRVNVSSTEDARGIIPEHLVFQNIDEFIDEVDAVKDYAIKLIHDERQ